jgi:anaerobic selenocysteine-containing dehydrogenase
MGRGLSDLQKTILLMAQSKRTREGRDQDAVVIFRIGIPPAERDVTIEAIRKIVPYAFIYTRYQNPEKTFTQIAVRLTSLAIDNDYSEVYRLQALLIDAGYRPQWQRVDWEEADVTSEEILSTYPAPSSAARVTVCRAFDRLVQRGLAIRQHSGVYLTYQGASLAGILSANTHDNIITLIQ